MAAGRLNHVQPIDRARYSPRPSGTYRVASIARFAHFALLARHHVSFRGRGARIWDADGNELLDYVGSWGPLILGHAHPSVVDAMKPANMVPATVPTALETELAGW